MKRLILFIIFMMTHYMAHAGTIPVSKETGACVECHKSSTPRIVTDWLKSRHSSTPPEKAAKKPALERRISFSSIDRRLMKISVGCYECHSANLQARSDVFEHFGFRIHTIVSLRDCAVCHPLEEGQFRNSKKANAHNNLANNAVFSTLLETVTGLKKLSGPDLDIESEKPSEFTIQETCYGCHGTEVRVTTMEEVATRFGNTRIPRMANWPNQGIGRLNPDGSRGVCTACHPGHSFSIEVARKPFTCARCHFEPNVPAWNVYKESKHGYIFDSGQSRGNFNAVPWKLGIDFRAPACSTCHNSLITTKDGSIIAERTHDFGARLWVRLFGLPYSHPQPLTGDTSIIRNKDGHSLPTTFSGEKATDFLISAEEQKKRQEGMKRICNGCHSKSWAENHFAKLDSTFKETDQMVFAATGLVSKAWANGIADPFNLFDETVEQRWFKQWFFFANSVKYASAMAGAQNYSTFKNGWWDLTNNLREMKDRVY